MKGISTLSCLAASFSVAHAAPASARPAAAPISTQCINTEIRANWLIGECLTGTDSTTRIKSAVYLPNKVENSDGDLKWKSDGEYRRSCSDCTVSDAKLTCSCKTAWGSNRGSRITSSINLENHVSVYSGHLLSDLTGAPIVPSESSSNPIPQDFYYSFGGNTTCPDADGPGTDYCKKQVSGCKDSSPTQRTGEFTFDGPINCYVPVIYFPQYHYQFEALKLTGEGAWDVLGYADEACSGEPVERVDASEKGKCKAFSTRVKAVSVRPAFNGDGR